MPTRRLSTGYMPSKKQLDLSPVFFSINCNTIHWSECNNGRSYEGDNHPPHLRCDHDSDLLKREIIRKYQMTQPSSSTKALRPSFFDHDDDEDDDYIVNNTVITSKRRNGKTDLLNQVLRAFGNGFALGIRRKEEDHLIGAMYSVFRGGCCFL